MRKQSIDYFALILTLIIITFGIVMVYSATYYLAASKEMYDNDGMYFFKRQIIGAAIGFAFMLFLMFFDYHRLKKLRYLLFIVAIAFLAAVLIPGVGRNINGSTRWIYIAGFSIQPSEIAKLALIVFMAYIISENRNNAGGYLPFKKGTLPCLLLVGICCVLIIKQPNFSAVICLCVLMLIMLIVGGAPKKHIVPLSIGGIAAGVIVMFAQSYRANRVETFLDPWSDPSDSGYQIVQSLYAIGGGGLFGRGIGNSMQKLLYLPFGESDFIFSIIVEELGLVGGATLLILYLLLALRGVKIAMKAPDMFGTMLAVGIVSIISIQVLINVAVVTNSIPATGVSLPFVSYGSSSLIIFMGMIGILLNISRQARDVKKSKNER